MHRIGRLGGIFGGEVGLFGITVYECDECGCAVSDPDLHMDRVHPRPVAPESGKIAEASPQEED